MDDAFCEHYACKYKGGAAIARNCPHSVIAIAAKRRLKEWNIKNYIADFHYEDILKNIEHRTSNKEPLFAVFRDVNDTDADGFCGDGVQFGEAFERGGDLVLAIWVGGNDDGDGVVGAGGFVLEDAGDTDGVVGENSAYLGEDAGLVFGQQTDIKPADEVIDFVDEGRDFASGFEA